MKVFVTGVAGQLGHDVVNELTKRGHQAVGSDIAPTLESCASYVPLDITDAAAVEQTILQVQPDAIVHCAAWTLWMKSPQLPLTGTISPAPRS